MTLRRFRAVDFDRLIAEREALVSDNAALRERVEALEERVQNAEAKVQHLEAGAAILEDARVDAHRLREAIEYFVAIELEGSEVPGQGDPIDSYGRYQCGCSWDSGPHSTYCSDHSPFLRLRAALGKESTP